MGKDVIIACDFSSIAETLIFLEQFGSIRPYVKVGMELYYAEGPAIIRELKTRGHMIFLDLKLHDIPNTVKRAMRILASLNVDMINLHAAGTKAMMEAAMEGAVKSDGTRPLVIAVTQLTSTSEEQLHNDILIKESLKDTVLAYAANAKSAGLDGVVCSPLESQIIHQKLSNNFITVTPGIRFPDDDKGDQVRVTSPALARELGSDYIVVGRPITQSANPVDAYYRCINEFLGQEAK